MYHYLFVFLSFHICHFIVRRVWRYQRSKSGYRRRTDNTMAKRKSTEGHKKDLQNIHFCTYKTKDRVTWTTPKTGGELRCSGSVSSSFSTSDTRRVNLVTNTMTSHEWGKDREVLTTSCSSFFDLRLSGYHVYPSKVSFNFFQVSAICRHTTGVFNIFVFLAPVLKQYTNFEILAGACIGQENKLLSVSFWLCLLSWFHFLLHFYVDHTIHFSDRKWYFYEHGNAKSP